MMVHAKASTILLFTLVSVLQSGAVPVGYGHNVRNIQRRMVPADQVEAMYKSLISGGPPTGGSDAPPTYGASVPPTPDQPPVGPTPPGDCDSGSNSTIPGMPVDMTPPSGETPPPDMTPPDMSLPNMSPPNMSPPNMSPPDMSPPDMSPPNTSPPDMPPDTDLNSTGPPGAQPCPCASNSPPILPPGQSPPDGMNGDGMGGDGMDGDGSNGNPMDGEGQTPPMGDSTGSSSAPCPTESGSDMSGMNGANPNMPPPPPPPPSDLDPGMDGPVGEASGASPIPNVQGPPNNSPPDDGSTDPNGGDPNSNRRWMQKDW